MNISLRRALPALVSAFLTVMIINSCKTCPAGTKAAKPPAIEAQATISLRFSPGGGCTEAIVEEIRKAEKQIFVLAYSFTSDSIAKALAEAKQRGVEVNLIIDGGRVRENGGDTRYLDNRAINLFVDKAHGIQHQKVIIIDPAEPAARVIMGSFNFTGGAETSNSENSIIIHSAELAKTFLENWTTHRQHSKEYLPYYQLSWYQKTEFGYMFAALLILISGLIWGRRRPAAK
jgi:phosphatidylserine/phosphatidylglycerophosphate/cardiolipin synthase-like enzyme